MDNIAEEVIIEVLKKLNEQSMEHRQTANKILESDNSICPMPEPNYAKADYHIERAKEINEIIDCITKVMDGLID
jgi:hypothetical protein